MLIINVFFRGKKCQFFSQLLCLLRNLNDLKGFTVHIGFNNSINGQKKEGFLLALYQMW
jgi:hypothetical protein